MTGNRGLAALVVVLSGLLLAGCNFSLGGEEEAARRPTLGPPIPWATAHPTETPFVLVVTATLQPTLPLPPPTVTALAAVPTKQIPPTLSPTPTRTPFTIPTPIVAPTLTSAAIVSPSLTEIGRAHV